MSEVIVRLTSDHIKVKGAEYVRDVVRCQNCKHRDDDYVCYHWSSIDECKHTSPNGFCNFGEVRDE